MCNEQPVDIAANSHLWAHSEMSEEICAESFNMHAVPRAWWKSGFLCTWLYWISILIDDMWSWDRERCGWGEQKSKMFQRIKGKEEFNFNIIRKAQPQATSAILKIQGRNWTAHFLHHEKRALLWGNNREYKCQCSTCQNEKPQVRFLLSFKSSP